MIKKQGELTTQQIVILIILIVSVAVILFLIFRLNPGATSNKEICHNSVILKDKGKGFVSELDCRTNYVCISGGEECEGFSLTERINVNAESREELLKAVADKMTECWWMFGEGKLNYGEGLSTSVNCARCSEIKFDKIIQEKIKSVGYIALYDFLLTKMNEKQSYLEYLYDVNDLSSLKIQQQFEGINIQKDVIDTSKKYSVLTGIDNNLLGSDAMLRVYLVVNSDISSKTKCKDFITKT